MEVEESQLDGFIEALLRDTTLLIEKLGVDTTGASRFHEGSDRYQNVSNAFEQLQHVSHALADKGDRAWDDTQLPNQRDGRYLADKLKSVKEQLQDMKEDRPSAS